MKEMDKNCNVISETINQLNTLRLSLLCNVDEDELSARQAIYLDNAITHMAVARNFLRLIGEDNV